MSRPWNLKVVLWALLWLLPLGWLGQGYCHAAEMVRIGVLSHRGSLQTILSWQPTAQYLEKQLGQSFQIVPLAFEEIAGAVKRREVSFVIVNTGIYVDLEFTHGVSKIATLSNSLNGNPTNSFGGVIFTRKEQKSIQSLEDLRNRRFAAVDATSLGGFQMAQRELLKVGVDPWQDFASLTFLQTHDKVVLAVAGGEFDVGTVRTDVLERMAAEGLVALERLRIINPQTSPDFPFLRSTPIYPEWPIAAVHGVDTQLAERVAMALMKMQPDNPASRAGGYYGWTIPLDYQPVHALYRELELGPYKNLTAAVIHRLWQQNWPWLSAIGGLVLALIAALFAIHRLNGRLRALLAGVESNQAAILNSVGEAIYGLDLQGNCTFVNPVMAKLTGFSAQELLGQSVHRKIHHSHGDGSCYEEAACPVRQTLVAQQMVTVDDECFWRKDGSSFPVEYVATPVFDAEDTLIGGVVVFRDISARREAEQALQESSQRAHEASRAKSEFLGVMSHELRTPLNAIIGPLEMVKMQCQQPELGTYLDLARKGADDLLDIISSVLDVVAIDSESYASTYGLVSPIKAAAKVVEILGPKAQDKKVMLRWQADAELMDSVTIDRSALNKVLFNVVGNAVKFTHQGEVKIILSSPDLHTLKIIVQDTGIGMEKADLSTIFNTFEQKDSSHIRRYGGCGLGLAITKRLLDHIGGTIEIVSEPQQGTEVTLKLPLQQTLQVEQAQSDRQPLPAQEMWQGVLKGRHVLVVDDSLDNRLLMVKTLTDDAMQVMEARDGFEAVELFKQHRFDLILMDVQMPVMDGYQATRLIRHLERQEGRDSIPIIATTAHTLPEDIKQCQLAGCDSHLAKPYTHQQLLEEVVLMLTA
uniref:histidine kinase n=1 Tax=Magnetococcus massalia (strain MO-1) TaxID=451514 RepID=A0A1S7LHW7_MAGMO|nr:putative Histidine kinase with PAS domain, HisKA domain, HATPase c domain and Response regulator receiver domain [Candidatus Magnetococcus massalia]